MSRTTLAFDEFLLEQIRSKARRENRTLRDCVDELLRLGLAASAGPQRSPDPLPRFSLGAPAIDLADRDALLDLLEEHA